MYTYVYTYNVYTQYLFRDGSDVSETFPEHDEDPASATAEGRGCTVKGRVPCPQHDDVATEPRQTAGARTHPCRGGQTRVQVVTATLTHSLTHPLTHSLTHPLTDTLTHSLTHPHTHSLTHSPTHSPTHPLTHPLTHLACWPWRLQGGSLWMCRSLAQR